MSPVATAVLAYLPSPDRGVWYVGPIPIRAYALCIIAGIVIAVLWGERRFVARGGAPGTVTDVAVFAVPFGLVGGRLYHVMTDWQTYFGPGGNPIDALKIWQGGLGIWGAVALGAVGAWIGCRRRGVPLPFFADAVAPGIVAAQAVGRLGNWFNQELYGSATTLPWGLEIYRRVDPATGAPDPLGGVALDRTPIEIVQPTFLYELIWNLLVAALVVWADRRFRLGHGRAFAVYVAGYTAGRFVIEQLRTDYATRVFGDIRINVVVSAVVFVLAVLYIVLARRGREVLAVTGSRDDAKKPAEEPVPVGGRAAGSGTPDLGKDVAPSATGAGTATPAADTPPSGAEDAAELAEGAATGGTSPNGTAPRTDGSKAAAPASGVAEQSPHDPVPAAVPPASGTSAAGGSVPDAAAPASERPSSAVAGPTAGGPVSEGAAPASDGLVSGEAAPASAGGAPASGSAESAERAPMPDGAVAEQPDAAAPAGTTADAPDATDRAVPAASGASTRATAPDPAAGAPDGGADERGERHG